MHKILPMATIVLTLIGSSAFAADPIVGNWRTKAGETANIAPCGTSKFCITVKTGAHAGKTIGLLSNDKGRYKGKITDPGTNKTYTGKARIKGRNLEMSGCVLGVLCQTQIWTRM